MVRRLPAPKVIATALLGAALLTGCADDDGGPLDAGLLADLATAKGDKQGNEWTGDFDGVAPTIDCDCPTVEVIPTEGGGTYSADLCLLAGDGGQPIQVDVVHADGFVATKRDLDLSGAIYADDSVVLAGIQDLSNAFGSIQIYSRLDGQFSSDQGSAQLNGLLRQRIVADLATDSVDCEATHDLAIAR
jgi:hypothetical protein